MELGGFRPKWSADDHRGILDALRKTRFGAHLPALMDLRTWRNACDYEESLADDPQKLLEAALASATRILKI